MTRRLLTPDDVDDEMFETHGIWPFAQSYDADQVDDFMDDVRHTIRVLWACVPKKDDRVLDEIVAKAISILDGKREGR